MSDDEAHYPIAKMKNAGIVTEYGDAEIIGTALAAGGPHE